MWVRFGYNNKALLLVIDNCARILGLILDKIEISKVNKDSVRFHNTQIFNRPHNKTHLYTTHIMHV